ncbi:intracellular short-chain-length polyhydroxyalkanoate depolymerase [Lentibacillus saliphilus]|uniref:intracellular short-chain-length polyhydroxyalkanoate depolymerase n=1 Tax=Lentibacillus saliphilus TaxID=2737028 RepID=UPI001C30BB73|nr:alpha/beta hydrolase [Lentibacillus saliphilus]
MHIRTVTLTNGENMAYREREGGEDVLILVHGNMTSSVHWDVLIEKLPARFKVYAIDLRGFGASSYVEQITDIADFSNDLKQFVDQMGLRDFSLIGWSMGGAVCQQFCADYPDYCKKLFLLASASSRGYPYYASDEQGMPDVTKRVTTLEDIYADQKWKMIQDAYNTNNYSMLKQVWDMLIYTTKQPNPDQYQIYLEDMTTQRNLAECYQALNRFNISNVHNGLVQGEDKIKAINIPVMIAWGENDLVVTRQMTEELIEDYGRKAQQQELKNCGHSPMIDDLDQLIDTIEAFL